MEPTDATDPTDATNPHRPNQRMMVISAFMRVKAFPRKLRRRVRKYYRDLVSQNSAISMEFSELPRDLSREVSFFLVNSVSTSFGFSFSFSFS